MRVFAMSLVRAAILAVLCIASAHAQPTPGQPAPPDRAASPGNPGWTADANGCRVWNPYPAPDETLTWSGPCVKGTAHGRGAVQWFTRGERGSLVEGEYRWGRVEGRVAVVSADGAKYEGGWNADQRSGRGVQTWPNGNRYEGLWADNRAEGQGTLSWADGDSVSGHWRAGCLNARGRTYTVGALESDCR